MYQCPNCSAHLEAQYCPVCGQQRIDPRDLTARRFFHELADELGTLRSKFKTIRTVRALAVPGLLTAEFLAGHRQRYLSPIKLYFVCAALFFLAAPLAGFTLPALMADDRTGNLARLVATQARGVDPAIFSDRFGVRLQSVYTLTFGSGIIVLALALQLAFRRAIPFGAHLVFALHYFSFLYLITAVAGLSRRLGVADNLAAGAAVCLIAPYLFMALKRVYPGTAPWILAKSAALLVLMFAFNFAADAAAIRLTLALL